MSKTPRKKFSPEVKERAVRLYRESLPDHPSEWAAMKSIASKVGCTSETLRKWVRQAERDSGRRAGPTTRPEADAARWRSAKEVDPRVGMR